MKSGGRLKKHRRPPCKRNGKDSAMASERVKTSLTRALLVIRKLTGTPDELPMEEMTPADSKSSFGAPVTRSQMTGTGLRKRQAALDTK